MLLASIHSLAYTNEVPEDTLQPVLDVLSLGSPTTEADIPEWTALQPALAASFEEAGGVPECRGPADDSVWVVGTHHKTGTVLWDAVMHKVAAWGDSWNNKFLHPLADPAVKSCVYESGGGKVLGEAVCVPPLCVSSLKQQQQQASSEPVLEVPSPVRTGNNSMHNNFFFDSSCMNTVKQEGDILRLRVMQTTPESWPLQLKEFKQATGGKKLKLVHSVRDPLDIIISAYFYDVSGGEQQCREVPSHRLSDLQQKCGDHPGEACTALRKHNAAHTSFSEALQKMAPRLGVLVEAFDIHGELEVEAGVAKALKKSHGSPWFTSYQVDLGQIMHSFDSTMGSVFSFLGIPGPIGCAKAIKELDVSAGRKGSSFSGCIAESKANGTDVHELEQHIKTLGSSGGIVDEENWYASKVAPIERLTPDACGPCAGMDTALGACHLASPALDPVRSKVRAALKGSKYYTQHIAELRSTLGYHGD
jgi:hypothetical protein